jgi:predicted AlkP superfamily phosphohydrolase/phosphomutase
MKKVLIIGLDGATFEVIKPLASCGKLPTFKFLLENGAHGILKSTIPFLTIPAWPSFYTGKNPGKHGVFDFLTVHNFDPKERRVRSAKDIKSKSLWKILSENKKKSLVFNVPLTYPPEEINGILVGGMLSVIDKNFAYPEKINEILKNQNYKIDFDVSEFVEKEEPEAVSDLINLEEKRFNIWKTFYTARTWDFSMIVFQSSDVVCHNLWPKQNYVLKIYQHLDSILLRMLDLIDNETTLLLMSDHGFSGKEKTVNILAWLANEGYLVYKKSGANDVSQKRWREIAGRKKDWNNFAKKIFLRLGFDQQKSQSSKLFHMIRQIIPRFLRKRIKLPTSKKSIDFLKTKAYAQLGFNSTWGININLEDREKFGIVKREEYNKLRKEIISKLKNLTFPNTNDKIFKDIKLCEEIYSGKYIKEAPDIIFTLNSKKWLAVARFDNNLFAPTTWRNCSYHDADGIFLAYQKSQKTKKQLENLSIYDITPTVLDIFGIQKDNEMDGKIINLFNL